MIYQMWQTILQIVPYVRMYVYVCMYVRMYIYIYIYIYILYITQNRLREIQMYDIMREILFYAMFLWVLLVISYGFRDPNAYHMKNNIQSTLVDLGMGEHGATENSFNKVWENTGLLKTALLRYGRTRG